MLSLALYPRLLVICFIRVVTLNSLKEQILAIRGISSRIYHLLNILHKYLIILSLKYCLPNLTTFLSISQ